VTIVAGGMQNSDNQNAVGPDFVNDAVRKSLGSYPTDITPTMAARGEKRIDRQIIDGVIDRFNEFGASPLRWSSYQIAASEISISASGRRCTQKLIERTATSTVPWPLAKAQQNPEPDHEP
jgi:hypothetical protein